MKLTKRNNSSIEKCLQRIPDLCLLDCEFMSKHFEYDTASTELILSILLNKPSLRVINIQAQFFEESSSKPPFHLLMQVTDLTGEVYKVSIYRGDKETDPLLAQCYIKEIQVSLHNQSTEHSDLYCIVLLENDILRLNQPLYRIRHTIECNGMSFEDGIHIMFVNGSYQDNTPLGQLIHDLSCKNPENMNYYTLAEDVKFLKESNEGIDFLLHGSK